MKFTIKTALIGLGSVSVLAATLFSKSIGFIYFVSSTILLAIPLMLVFAICDGRKSRRPFWIGCFTMSVACLFASYSGSLQSVEYEIASLVCGSPPVPTGSTTFGSPVVGSPAFQPISPSVPSFAPTFYPPISPVAQASVNFPAPTSVYFPTGDYARLSAVTGFVPFVFSLFTGLIGGILALWISQSSETEKQSLEPQ